jgi:signal peptidase I
MPIGSTSSEKSDRKYLRDVVQHCLKRFRQDYDILTEKQAGAFRKEIQKAQNHHTARAPHPRKASDRLIEAYNQTFPQKSKPGWRENGESLLVAIIIAMAFRAFFLQPFKIPTGSMQPTLNGIIVRATNESERTWWYKLVSRPIFGERRVLVLAEEPGRFEGMARPAAYRAFHSGGKTGFFNILPIEATEFQVGNVVYSIPIDATNFRDQVVNSKSGETPLLAADRYYRKGDVILDCVVQTGDQLFVDRMSYNFSKPARGDVFVFETAGIDTMQGSLRGDFYIKRLAGTPGDTLRIEKPFLHINGTLADHIGFRRVMSLRNGYGGYVAKEPPFGLKFPYTVGEDRFFALGDNSNSSYDSRDWGTVPRANLVGKGFFVYWPFTKHFGRIE